MRVEKRNREWWIILEARCPACDSKVEALKPKSRRFSRARKCLSCGYLIDPVYFN